MRATASIAILLALLAGPLAAGEPGDERPPEVVYVPHDEMDALLARHERGVVLSVAEYLELWRAAKEGRTDPAPGPDADAVVLGGRLTGEVGDETATIRAEYTVRVLVEGMVKVPFPLAGAGVASLTADDRPALVSAEGGVPSLVLVGKGDHRVVLDLAARVAKREDLRELSLTLPPGAGVFADLAIPDGMEPVPGTLGGTWRTVESEDGSRLLAHLPPASELALALRPRRDESTAADLLLAEGRSLHTVGNRLLVTVSLIEATLIRPVRELALETPPGSIVTEVASPGLDRWAPQEDGGVRLRFARRTAGTEPIVVRMETALPGPGEVVLPEVRLAGAADERGLAAVRFETGVTGRIVSADGYARVVVPAPKQQQERAGPPDPGPVLHGAAAAYRYWSADRSLTVRTEEPERRVDADVAASLTLSAGGREVRAVFEYRPHGERVFSLAPELPPLYDLVSVEVQAPVAHRWRETDDGGLAVEFPAGCPPGSRVTVSILARLDNEEWRDESWESTSFPLPVLDPGAGGWVEGRLAVFATDEFELGEEDVAGLRAEPVERLGAPGARLGWTWRGGEASGRLVVGRRDPKVTVRHVGVVAPGEKTARYSGYLHYTVLRAGVKRFRFTVSGGYGDLLDVTPPLGVEAFRRRLESGLDLWEFELPERVTGEILVRFALETEMEPGEDGRRFETPVVHALDADGESAWVAVETGENLEVGVVESPGLRETGPEIPGGLVPSRGLLAAWQVADPDWGLVIGVRRHEDMPVLTAFVTRAEIVSVVGEDGTVRSRAVYRLLNSGRQFLVVRLSAGSSLWGAHVGGRPVKPVLAEDGYRVPLATTADGEAVEVSLTWETANPGLSGSGTLELAAPELPGLVGATADWRIWLPSDFDVVSAGGVFGAPPPEPPAPWIARALADLIESAAVTRSVGADSAAPTSLAVESRAEPVPDPTADRYFEGDEDRAEDEKAPANRPPPAPKPSAPPPPEEPAPSGAEMPGDEARPGGGEDMPASKDARDGLAAGERLGGLAAPARLGKAGSLPIDIRFTPAGTLRRVDALGVRGSVSLRYVDRPARTSLGWVVSVLVLIAGVVLTGQLRRAGPRDGPRIPPLLYVVGLGGFATFAPAWFGVRDPTVWDGIARGAVLAAAAIPLAAGIRALGSLRARAGAAAAAILLAAVLAPAARAEEGETVYVPYDPEKMEDLDAGGKVFLPFERFRELWNAVHPDRAIDRPEQAPVPYVVSGAAWEGSVEGVTAKLVATLDLVLLRDGYIEVPLALSPAVVDRATADGEPVRVLARGGRQVLLIEGRGARRVVLELRVGVAREGDERSVAMHLPPIPRSRLVFRLPAEGLDTELAGWAEPVVDGRTLTAEIGPAGGFRLAWRPRTETPEMDARVEAETREALSSREGRIDLRMRTTWRVVTGSIRTVRYDLAADFALLDVAGPDVKAWSRDGETLTVDLAREVGDETTVTLSLLRPDGLRTRSIGVPAVAPVGVVRERGVLAVAAPAELRVTAGAPQNLERIAAAPADFAGLLPADCSLHSAWRFVMRPLALDVATEPVLGEVRAAISARHLVAREWLTSGVTFQFTVRDDGTFRFPVRVPSDLELVSVTGAGLDRYWRDGDTLVLTTANPVRGDFRVDVTARRRLDPDAVAVPLPEIHALEAEREVGRILVAHAPSLSLTLLEDRGLVKQDVAAYAGWPKIDARQKNAYAWRADGGEYSVSVARSFPTARVRPVATTRLQVLDDSVVVDTAFVFEISNAGEDTFRVFFPEGEGREPIVDAEGTRRVDWEEGEHDGRPGRFLTVRLQQPALGTYAFRVVTEKRLARGPDRPNEGSVTVRGPVPLGENAASYVMVENQSSGEVRLGTREGLEKAAPETFPYAPAGLDLRLLTAGLKGRTVDWSLGLTLVIHDFASFPDLLVSSAEILVAVGRDGWTRNRATWDVLNRSRQFLELSLPAGSLLEAVRVGDRPVKPGRRLAGGEERILVPLSRMRPGDVSTRVTVFWSRALPGVGRNGADVELADFVVEEPVLHGFEVEKTFFTVCLPRGYDYSFDGNMRAVTETAIEVFKLAKGVEQLARLAEVQGRGSFEQRLVATENFYRTRRDLERQAQEATRDLAKLGEKQRDELRSVLLVQQRELGLIDQTVAGQTAETFDLSREQAEPAADAEQALERTRELAQNQRDQSYRFQGKKGVANQEWDRNYRGPQGEVPPGQRDPADPQPGAAGPGIPPPSSGAYTAQTRSGAPYFFGRGGGGGGTRLDDVTNGLEDLAGPGFDAAGGRRAGLLSLPVVVPERGEIHRFEKRNGGAELEVSVSTPGDGRGAAGFGLFVLTVGALVGWYRWRPDERYRGFKPSCLILFGVLAAVFVPTGELLFLPVLVVVGGGVWLTIALRKSGPASRAS